MVENNSKPWAESLNNLVIDFFKEYFPHFVVKNETIYGPYWGVSLIDNKGIGVRVRGENDGFDIVVDIDNEEFPLWKFDRSVIDATDANDENIFYQLSVLESFLSDNKSPLSNQHQVLQQVFILKEEKSK
ncbi:hypothetical protein [Flavobacterium psychrophilum]|nr:hypothetical protein [Flavobacterium psychrophilum]SNA84771.1 conserved hypothetical protein [Flavobacterium psychrophilum]SNB12248.1 conserved hypothetical protein [Flavobacterium psychrophilum]